MEKSPTPPETIASFHNDDESRADAAAVEAPAPNGRASAASGRRGKGGAKRGGDAALQDAQRRVDEAEAAYSEISKELERATDRAESQEREIAALREQLVRTHLDLVAKPPGRVQHGPQEARARELTRLVHALKSSNAWRLGAPLRMLERRAPWALGLLTQMARAFVWTLKLQLPQRLAEARRFRRERRLILEAGLFDPDWYLQTYPDVALEGAEPLSHFLRYGWKAGMSPSAEFDLPGYVKTSGAQLAADVNPLLHYLESGAHRGVRSSGTHDRPLWRVLLRDGRLKPRQGAEAPIDGDWFGDPGKTQIALVTHEASRTGAPLILLAIAREMARTLPQAELTIFVNEGGPLVDQFNQYGHVVEHHGLPFVVSDKPLLDDYLKGMARLPSVAYCNTANVPGHAAVFKKHAIPVITLVHEELNKYASHEVERLHAVSDRLVFPSRAMIAIALDVHPNGQSSSRVLPQGLLNASFGCGDRRAARTAVCAEIGAPEDAIIVLGCGVRSRRKAVDVFAEAAVEAIRQSRGVHFLWVGGPDGADPTAENEARSLIRRAGVEEFVHWVSERSDVEPYFLAADIFVLPSRGDPFPCVVHEAMACRLPVIAFAGAGGAPEAFMPDAGLTAPLGDAPAMAAAILRLAGDRDMLAAMGENAERIVRTRYRFSDYAERLLDLAQRELGVNLSRPGRTPRDVRPLVLFTTRDWGISGVNSFTEELIDVLHRQGIDARLCFIQQAHADDAAHVPKVPYEHLGLGHLPWKRQWRALIDEISNRGPVIVVPNYDYGTSAISPSLPNDVGVVGIVHSDDVEHYDHALRLGRYWNRLVCVSNATREKTIEINQGFAERTVVITHGVREFDRVPRPVRDAGAPLRLVHTGRLEQHQKRVLDFVPLVQELERRGVEFEFTIVGDGGQRPELERGLARHIRAGRVTLSGRMDRARVIELLRTQDVFVLMSDFEGLPMSLLEAMAQRCVPVVTAVASGVTEIVADGVNGCICPLRDPAAMAARIADLNKSRRQLKNYSDGAFSAVHEGGFRAEDMGLKWAALLREVWEEILNGDYKRPEPIIYNAQAPGIVVPPFLAWNPHLEKD